MPKKNILPVLEVERDGRKIALSPMVGNELASEILPFKTVCSKAIAAEGSVTPAVDEFLIEEFRTHIFYGSKYVASENCTKTHLKEFAAGRLVTEGVISPNFFKSEFAVYASCDLTSISIVPSDPHAICEFEISDADAISYKPVPMPKAEEIFSLINSINSQKDRDYLSKIHAKTQGTHCCYLWKNGKVLGEFEDISRHSAADKCIGYACINGIELSDAIIFSTGRTPADFIVKMQRAGVGTLVTKSVPTADGVRLARKIGINLICKAWPDSFRIFSPDV